MNKVEILLYIISFNLPNSSMSYYYYCHLPMNKLRFKEFRLT